MSLPKDPKARKKLPVYSGLMRYFPDALAAVAEVSRIGNDQHHPGEPLHWDKSKSTDELDAAARHMLDMEESDRDDDGVLHAAKLAWRALANLQRIADSGANVLAEQDGVPDLSKTNPYREAVRRGRELAYSEWLKSRDEAKEHAWEPWAVLCRGQHGRTLERRRCAICGNRQSRVSIGGIPVGEICTVPCSAE